MGKWLVVHSEDAYNTNNRVLGYRRSIHNVDKIEINDEVIYYQTGGYIKGLYSIVGLYTNDMTEAPEWVEQSWTSSQFQYQLHEVIELSGFVDIEGLISRLNLFEGRADWYVFLQGVLNIRPLDEHDYQLLRNEIIDKKFAEDLEDSMNLEIDDLRERINETDGTAEELTRVVKSYKRNPDVVAYALKVADGICGLCGSEAPFNRADGTPYLEVHHKISLSQQGLDNIGNVIALCPNCHRRAHHGNEAINWPQ